MQTANDIRNTGITVKSELAKIKTELDTFERFKVFIPEEMQGLFVIIQGDKMYGYVNSYEEGYDIASALFAPHEFFIIKEIKCIENRLPWFKRMWSKHG